MTQCMWLCSGEERSKLIELWVSIIKTALSLSQIQKFEEYIQIVMAHFIWTLRAFKFNNSSCKIYTKKVQPAHVVCRWYHSHCFFFFLLYLVGMTWPYDRCNCLLLVLWLMHISGKSTCDIQLQNKGREFPLKPWSKGFHVFSAYALKYEHPAFC